MVHADMDPVMHVAATGVLGEALLKNLGLTFWYPSFRFLLVFVILCSAVPGDLAHDRRRLSGAELHPMLGASRPPDRSILLLLSVSSSPPHSPVRGQSPAFLSTGMHIYSGHSL